MAAASVTPSPTNSTRAPSRCSDCTSATLPVGDRAPSARSGGTLSAAAAFATAPGESPDATQQVTPPLSSARRAAAADGGGKPDFDTDALVPVLLWQPLSRDARVSITTLSAQEAFGIYVKAALLVGIVLASPWIFYQLWLFVAAGLGWLGVRRLRR